MQIFDVHAHLEMPEFAADLTAVLDRAARAGVDRILCVATDLPSSRRCIELARRFPGRLCAAVGIHPNHRSRARPEDMREIERLASMPEVVAIGETGLDFHHDFTAPEQQTAAFRQHVRLALAAGKPLIVHSRKSDEEVLRILSQGTEAVRGVRHCFDGSAQVAARYVELGLHVSFGGAVTRPGHKKLKAAARSLPAGRLLVETDCPYQAPAQHAGTRNEPAFIIETLEALAALRQETTDSLASTTTRNAVRLFLTDQARALSPSRSNSL